MPRPTRSKPTNAVAARSFTLLELLIACALCVFLVAAYVRALDDADDVREVMRSDDLVRFWRMPERPMDDQQHIEQLLAEYSKTKATAMPDEPQDGGIESHPPETQMTMPLVAP